MMLPTPRRIGPARALGSVWKSGRGVLGLVFLLVIGA